MTSFVKTTVFCTVALFLLCGFAFAQPQSEKPKAAVYVKGNPQGRDVLMMAVNTFLIKTGRYQMIAVDAIDLLAQEHIRQQSGAVSDNDIAKLGRDAGAQYVCVVERTELDGVSYVTTSMVSVQSKIAEFSDMKELPRGERVINVIERQINAMLGLGSGEEQGGDGYEQVSGAIGEEPPLSASYPYVNDRTETYTAPSSYSSSESRSDKSRTDGKPEREPKPKRKKGQNMGIGGVFASDFGGGVAWSEAGQQAELAMPYYGGGFFVFWDWVYLEFFGGLHWGGGKWENTAANPGDLPDMSRAYGSYGVFGKFPLIGIGPHVTLFPLYGIDYETSRYDSSSATLKYTNGMGEVSFDGKDDRPEAKTLSALWGKFGAGIDLGSGNSGIYFFVRIEALYGIRVTANDFEKYHAVKYIEPADVKPLPGRGLTVRVSVGFQ